MKSAGCQKLYDRSRLKADDRASFGERLLLSNVDGDLANSIGRLTFHFL